MQEELRKKKLQAAMSEYSTETLSQRSQSDILMDQEIAQEINEYDQTQQRSDADLEYSELHRRLKEQQRIKIGIPEVFSGKWSQKCKAISSIKRGMRRIAGPHSIDFYAAQQSDDTEAQVNEAVHKSFVSAFERQMTGRYKMSSDMLENGGALQEYSELVANIPARAQVTKNDETVAAELLRDRRNVGAELFNRISEGASNMFLMGIDYSELRMRVMLMTPDQMSHVSGKVLSKLGAHTIKEDLRFDRVRYISERTCAEMTPECAEAVLEMYSLAEKNAAKEIGNLRQRKREEQESADKAQGEYDLMTPEFESIEKEINEYKGKYYSNEEYLKGLVKAKVQLDQFEAEYKAHQQKIEELNKLVVDKNAPAGDQKFDPEHESALFLHYRSDAAKNEVEMDRISQRIEMLRQANDEKRSVIEMLERQRGDEQKELEQQRIPVQNEFISECNLAAKQIRGQSAEKTKQLEDTEKHIADLREKQKFLEERNHELKLKETDKKDELYRDRLDHAVQTPGRTDELIYGYIKSVTGVDLEKQLYAIRTGVETDVKSGKLKESDSDGYMHSLMAEKYNEISQQIARKIKNGGYESGADATNAEISQSCVKMLVELAKREGSESDYFYLIDKLGLRNSIAGMSEDKRRAEIKDRMQRQKNNQPFFDARTKEFEENQALVYRSDMLNKLLQRDSVKDVERLKKDLTKLNDERATLLNQYNAVRDELAASEQTRDKLSAAIDKNNEDSKRLDELAILAKKSPHLAAKKLNDAERERLKSAKSFSEAAIKEKSASDNYERNKLFNQSDITANEKRIAQENEKYEAKRLERDKNVDGMSRELQQKTSKLIGAEKVASGESNDVLLEYRETYKQMLTQLKDSAKAAKKRTPSEEQYTKYLTLVGKYNGLQRKRADAMWKLDRSNSVIEMCDNQIESLYQSSTFQNPAGESVLIKKKDVSEQIKRETDPKEYYKTITTGPAAEHLPSEQATNLGAFEAQFPTLAEHLSEDTRAALDMHVRGGNFMNKLDNIDARDMLADALKYQRVYEGDGFESVQTLLRRAKNNNAYDFSAAMEADNRVLYTTEELESSRQACNQVLDKAESLSSDCELYSSIIKKDVLYLHRLSSLTPPTTQEKLQHYNRLVNDSAKKLQSDFIQLTIERDKLEVLLRNNADVLEKYFTELGVSKKPLVVYVNGDDDDEEPEEALPNIG